MTVVLTAMNRFINEADGSQTAFIDGNQPERLCAPMVAHVEARGGKVHTGAPLSALQVDEASGSVTGLQMASGEVLSGFDYYVSAVPVDVMKKLVPARWSTMPYFRQVGSCSPPAHHTCSPPAPHSPHVPTLTRPPHLSHHLYNICQPLTSPLPPRQFDELEGIPVINLHIWFDRKLQSIDGLCFSRSPLLSVYADMSTCCKEYEDDTRSMLELVFAPCSPLAGSDVNWIAKTDEQIIDATMGELARLFPTEIANDEKWPATSQQSPQGQARLRKYAVVRVPRSVYAAIPGRNKYRPSQHTPIDNFVMAGDWTSQKFLGSMEGAVLGGKLAAEVIADRASGAAAEPPSSFGCGVKPVAPDVVQAAAGPEPRAPINMPAGAKYPIAFGGGQQGAGASPGHP